MDMDDTVDLEGLERAWRRVRAPETPESAPEDSLRAELARFIRNASAAGAMYGLLAMKTGGSAAEGVFRRLARQELDTEKRLQTEYFLLTGDTWAAPPVRPSAPSVAGAVRSACLAESDNADALEAAALRRPETRSAGLLGELASRERAHAQALRELLGLML